MTIQPANDALGSLHQRLVEGDPTATAELFIQVSGPLTDLLRSRSRRDVALVHDAIIDALMDLAKRPDSCDLSKGEIWTFLVIASRRNLLNLLRAKHRARDRDFRYMGVAEGEPAGNYPRLSEDGDADRELASQRLAGITDGVTGGMGEQDLSMIRLMADGIRATGPYAQVLRIADLPEADQRRQVKNAKDRLLKRLRRAATEDEDARRE